MVSYSLPLTPPPQPVSAFLISVSQFFTEYWGKKKQKPHNTKSHQELCAIHVDCEELTSHQGLSCSIAGRPMLLPAYFILIDQDSLEFY